MASRGLFIAGIILGFILAFVLPQVIHAQSANYAEDEVIVKFRAEKIIFNQSAVQVDTFTQRKNLTLKENLPAAKAAVFKITSGETVNEVIKRLKQDPQVELAQPNFRYKLLTINTDDTYKDNLWGLDNYGQRINTVDGKSDADTDAPEAWAINEGTNQEVIAAVIDTGVAYNHPDLLPNMWNGTNCSDENGNYLGDCLHGYDFGFDDKNPLPHSESHGTHVAGTIAAVKNNGQGIIGVAPQAKIMALQATLSDGYFYSTEIAKSINFAKYNGATVINASFGGSSDMGCIFLPLDELVYEAIGDFPGLFLAAAGNSAMEHDGSNYIDVPADYGHPVEGCWDGLPNVISVAATDSQDELASFSDYGVNFVDVAAPGVDVYSTIAEGYYLYEKFDAIEDGELPAGWEANGSLWGVESVLTFNSQSGWGQVLYPDVSGASLEAPYYTANADSNITSPTYDLINAPVDSTFHFRARCDTEYTDSLQDYMTLEFSSDGVTFSEADLGSGSGKFDEYALDDLDWDSDPDNDAYHYFDEVPLVGYLTSNFKFRLKWTTDSDDNNHRGCVVDNIYLNELTDGVSNTYDFYSGTSMSAPHVSGLAALIMGYSPSLTVEQVKSIIFNSGDSLASLDGKIVTGKRINAYNALRQGIIPIAPTLNPVTTPTKAVAQIISGSKEANTSIWLNGGQIVELDGSTTWSYQLNLAEGENSISLISKNSSGLDSLPTSAMILLDSIAPIVSSNIAAGAYKEPQTIALSCSEANCSIYYTLNNTTPTNASNLYSESLTINETTTIQARAYDQIGNQSVVLARQIIIDQVSPVLTASLASGTYNKPQTVYLTCNEANCSIYFTLNGEAPANNSDPYDAAIKIKISSVLKARAYDQAGNNSALITLAIDFLPQALVYSPASAGGPQIQVVRDNGVMVSSFFAYPSNLRGGYKIILADIDGDHNNEIIVAPDTGLGPHIRAYKFAGTFIADIMVYQPNFRGGVNITAADLDGDGREEIITAPASAGGPNIRAYKLVQGQFVLLDWFMAYQPGFKGGVNLTSGDLNGDGQEEIITAPAANGGPNIRAYKLVQGQFVLLDWFLAYQRNFTGGVNLITADLNGDNQAELITAPESAGGPDIRVYKLLSNNFQLQDQLMVYPTNLRLGINLASGDLDNNGQEELIVASKQGTSQVKIYNLTADHQLVLSDWFNPYGNKFLNGINLASGDLDNDGKAEIITAPTSGQPNIRIYDFTSQVTSLHSWFWGFQRDFNGGVNLGQ